MATLGEYQIFSEEVTAVCDQISRNEQLIFIDEAYRQAESVFYEACKPKIDAVVKEKGIVSSMSENTYNNMLSEYATKNLQIVKKGYEKYIDKRDKSRELNLGQAELLFKLFEIN